MNLSSKHLQQLLKKDSKGTKLSIYIPTHPSSNSQTIAEDTTRFKNSLKEVKNHNAYDQRELGEVYESLEKLVDDVDFWRNQDVGLAVFVDKDGYECYKLPYEITQATYVNKRLILSPLFVMHSIKSKFYVLDVNLTKPRLLQSHHGTFVVVNEDTMPASFQETVARDEYKVEQQHLGAPRGSGGDNLFHGHGPEDALEDDTREYLKILAKAVDEYMANEDLPLLIVGEKNRVASFVPNLNYKYVIDQTIEGNFETHTPQDLYNITIETMRDYESSGRRELIDQLLTSPPELVVMGYAEIGEAAQSGRVERMYVPTYRRTSDNVQPGTTESIILQLPSDIDELESVTRDVLAQAGTIVAVEIDAYDELTEAKALCRF